jgi:hypothetical protein
VRRALLGAGLVLFAAGVHVGLIYLGVYRRYPFEWWAVALLGVVVAADAFRRPRVAPRVVAAIAIVLAGVFGWATTVGTRIKRPELAIARGQQLAPIVLTGDDGQPLAVPRAGDPHRATLLVLFRGVW